MESYYNENDPFNAQWLRNLIAAGHLPAGEVDERDIRDVRPDDLRGFMQCHFFAGIGGWPVALQLARWPKSRPVWTGSCPCQPFSQTGRRGGFADERHLWPAWFHLIRACRPNVVFGEQVSSPDAIAWLDLVSADLEGEAYRIGPLVFPACSVGAPDIRHRLWFVADAFGKRREGNGIHVFARRQDAKAFEAFGAGALTGAVGNAGRDGDRKHARKLSRNEEKHALRAAQCDHPSLDPSAASPVAGFWKDARWHPCQDGKWRAVSPEPGAFPLAHGFPGRVGMLRAAGNAIVPPLAAELIAAYMETAP